MQKELLGQSLLEVVFNRLNLLETAYFGLRYLDFEGQTVRVKSETRITQLVILLLSIFTLTHFTMYIQSILFPVLFSTGLMQIHAYHVN